MKVSLEFYVRDDVVQISRELLGKVLCTKLNGQVTKAIITETEAYAGVSDKASHAYGGRRTNRIEPDVLHEHRFQRGPGIDGVNLR